MSATWLMVHITGFLAAIFTLGVIGTALSLWVAFDLLPRWWRRGVRR